MGEEGTDLPLEHVFTRLLDADFLKNYCEFAALYRPSIVTVLFEALDAQSSKRRAIGLEIAALYAAALEDLALWFYALRDWEPGSRLLFDVVDSTKITEDPRSKTSSEKALREMAAWSTEQLRTEFRLPSDEWLLAHGWGRADVELHKTGLSALREFVQEAFEHRTSHAGILVTSYNKIKHGALAIAATQNSAIGVSVFLPSRRGPLDEASGKHKINVGWIPCDDDELRTLANSVLMTSHVTWLMLNLVYLYRFDPTWKLPAWPFHSV